MEERKGEREGGQREKSAIALAIFVLEHILLHTPVLYTQTPEHYPRGAINARICET